MIIVVGEEGVTALPTSGGYHTELAVKNTNIAGIQIVLYE